MRRTINSATFSWLLVSLLAQSAMAKTEILILDESNWKECAPVGKEVDWIYGDYVLRNDHVVAVIAKPGPTRDANMTTRDVGACLIDFTSRKNPNDQLSAYYPGGRLFEFAAEATIKTGAGNSANTIEFVGKPLADYPELEGLKHSVIYRLPDDAHELVVESQVENTAAAPISVAPFDQIRIDRDFQMKVDTELNTFVAGDYWWNQAYSVTGLGHLIVYDQQKRSHLLYFRDRALAEAAPRQQVKKAQQTAQSNQPVEGKVALQPGESISYRRSIGAGRHTADVLGLVSGHLSGNGNLIITVTDDDGPIAGAKIEFKKGDEDFGYARTNKQGVAQFRMAVGEFTATVSALGRDDQQFPFIMEPKGNVTLETKLPRPAYVSAKITDEQGNPIACKVEFDSPIEDGDPYFGPDTYAWEVHNLIYTEDGNFRHAIPPGDYNVLISHGNEYDAVTRQISATRGEETSIEAVLKRTVDTTGWVSSDLHSHSSPSGDNTSSQLGRVLNLLAEHIEFAPCTEHNRVSSYVPHLERLEALDRMATCPGLELTGGPLPVNHQNAFPLHHHPHTQDGGGPRTDADPVEQIKRLRFWDNGSEKVVQENHPDIPRLLCDANVDDVPDEGHRGMFEFMDVIEVHPPQLILSPPEKSNPDNVFGNQIVHWLQMLNLGYRIPGVVNTDAHYTFHGSGWLRNYLKSSTDDPAAIDIDEMVDSTKRGHVIMSNGPFLEVSATDADATTGPTAIPGGDLSAPGKRVRLSIKVQCANWLDVNRVQVLINGRAPETLNFGRRDANTKFRSGTVKFDETIKLELTEDAHLVVATLGEGLSLGPVMGPEHGQDVPCAVSNPIFVDVDGDGFKPNKDLLDLPLPADLDGLPQP